MASAISAGTLERFTTFGDLLRFLRRRARLTQMELSIAVGYSDAQISRLEQNVRLPDPPVVEARFIPALDLEDDPRAAARLVELAAIAEYEDAPAVGLCPYKGLSHFDEGDAALFVGREALTAELVKRVLSLASNTAVGSGRFLAIIGASGCGKSSVVRAGLAAALRTAPVSATWPIHILTPTAHPLERLAAQLTQESGSFAMAARLMDDLASDARSLNMFARQLTRAREASRLVLVIDQFEELFTLCRLEEERNAFINNLLIAASEADGPVIVVITLRADFYASCATYPQLRDVLARSQEYIGAMSSAELRRAIEEPARCGRWDLEPGLAELMLRDIGQEPGALPLLSHALLATWHRRRGRTMTFSGYLASGGVSGAIAETAEAVFTDQFTPIQQVIARRIFLRLTELGDTTGATRRRVRLEELSLKPEDADPTQAVLNALADARLIITGEDSVEIAHEALIREWPRLHDWLEDNREGLHQHRHLTEAAQEWLMAGHEEGLLYRGARLVQAREWATLYADWMNAFEREFIEASIALNDREAVEREAHRRRDLEAAQKLAESERRRAEEQAKSSRQLRQRALYLTVALGIALIMALMAGLFGAQARRIALSARGEQRLALSRELAAAAVSNLDSDPEMSILLALEAVSITHSVDQSWTSEADNALRRALQVSRVELTLRGHTNRVWAVAYGTDCADASAEACRTLLYSTGDDGTVKAWDARTGEKLFTLYTAASRGRHSVAVYGNRLATPGDIGTVGLWDALTGENLLTLRGHTDWVSAVAFSPNGTRLATTSEDRTTRIWDVVTGKPLLTLRGHTGAVWAVAFSPDGRFLATAGEDNRTILWDAATGEHLLTLRGHAEPVAGIAFSPACRIAADAADTACEAVLATASSDHTVKVWDARTGEALLTLRGHMDAVWQVSFSPDGARLASASSDGKVKVWDAVSGQELLTLSGHTEPVVGVAFDPVCPSKHAVATDGCGAHLASASLDGTVRIWNVSFSRELLTFMIPDLSAAATSPNGMRLAAGLSDGVVKLWAIPSGLDAAGREMVELHTLRGHAGSVHEVAFSADGMRLASAGEDGTIRVWDPDSGSELLVLRGHAGSVLDIAFNLSGTRLATTGIDQTIRVWDTATGETLIRLAVPIWSYAIAFSPDDSYLAAGTNNGSVTLWDMTTSREKLVLRGHTGAIWSIAFGPDGKHLASGSNDRTVRIWDVQTGEELLILPAHSGAVEDVSFSGDGTRLASAGQDGTVRIWDPATGQEMLSLLGHTDAVADVAFSTDGTRLFTAATNGVVRLYLPQMGDLMKLAHLRATRTFTEEECQRYLHSRQDLCAAAGAEALLSAPVIASSAPLGLTLRTGGKVCEITDEAGLNDEFYNQTAYKGVQKAVRTYGWEEAVLESHQAADYERNLTAFMHSGCDLIVVPKGLYFGDIVRAAAEANHTQRFLVADWRYDQPRDNVWTQIYAVDQAAFLAGYVAAATTRTGKVATFGGAPMPSVTGFMDGFALGVAYYNHTKGTHVDVLGWNPDTREGIFAGGFVAIDVGRSIGEDVIAMGADIILPVAGRLGLGAAAAAKDHQGVYIVGVDLDWAVTYPEYSEIILTSIEKRLDTSVLSAVKAIADDTYQGGEHVGTLGNGGVSLAPFHTLDGLVSEETRAELAWIRAQIIAGTIKTVP